MSRILIIFFFSFSILLAENGSAQDTLPNISVKNYSGKIVISWRNNYGAKITTLNVQRSNDSLKNFSTFASVLNPMNRQNGIVDSKPINVKMFYRVFVAFEGGNYFFSPSQRPEIDSIRPTEKPISRLGLNTAGDTSIANSKLQAIPPPAAVILGKYIFTGKDNNVIIALPDVAKKKYSIKFFDDKDNFVFEVKKIADPYLILDKANFIHTGLFKYELYDNGELLEKYRVIISKETKGSN